ncbi:MAG: WxcM-like domain-containing protein [Candidatus Dadabacteria bacterium]|nr:WxcM-like domain-containing protein [Candidatus Dadabacteria bacterium]
MITKKFADHKVLDFPYAREMREVINTNDYEKMAIAIAVDMEQMNAHYHKTFDQIFFVLDGDMKFEFYDPANGNVWTVESSLNDLVIVKEGIHHKVLRASEHNRLLVLSIPQYDPDDENPSDKI